MYINRMLCVPTSLLYELRLLTPQADLGTETIIVHIKEVNEQLVSCWVYSIFLPNSTVRVGDAVIFLTQLEKLLPIYEMKVAHDTKTNFKFKRSSNV